MRCGLYGFRRHESLLAMWVFTIKQGFIMRVTSCILASISISFYIRQHYITIAFALPSNQGACRGTSILHVHVNVHLASSRNYAMHSSYTDKYSRSRHKNEDFIMFFVMGTGL